jgi:hypothetical protein
MRTGLLTILFVLGTASLTNVRARAQDTPAKTEAPTPATDPNDRVSSQAQQESDPAISVRYRFIEKYSVNDDPARPELLSQYRVGVRATQKEEREKAQGAPERSEFSHLTVYTERPAQVNKLGQVTSTVRRYDRFRRTQKTAIKAPPTPLMEGLTIAYRFQPGQKPQILSLTNDRPIREFEYREITGQVFLPQLMALFPQTPRRVGDTWKIPARAAYCLVNEVPEADEYEMTGTLVEVHKAVSSPTLTAVIGLTGQFNLSLGMSALNAQIYFDFEPPPVVPPSGNSGASPKTSESAAVKRRGQRDDDVITAQGRVSKVLMAWKVSSTLPSDESRLKLTSTYELHLERKLATQPNEAGASQTTPIAVPNPLPAATPGNSWLVYEDDLGRFHFLHPQELEVQLPGGTLISQNEVHLVDQRPEGGKDVLILTLAPGAENPQGDRDFRDLNQFRRGIDAYWAKTKFEILRGPEGWLPDAEWAPLKVYRKEVGVKAAATVETGKSIQRFYEDYFLVLAEHNKSLQVQSITVRDDHVAFRTQAEGVIKSIRFEPWNGGPKPVAVPFEASVTPPK